MDTERYTHRPFVITGCGRSGTKYTAAVLSAAGVPCTHERVFTGRPDDHVALEPPVADSSWLAAPYLRKLTSTSLVLHQIRDPLAVIKSHVARGFFNRPSYQRPLWKHLLKRAIGQPPSGQFRLVSMVRSFLPGVFAEPTPILRAARFWFEWNVLVEDQAESYGLERMVYRVEAIDARFLVSLIERITGTTSSSNVQSAISAVPRNLNTGPSTKSISIDDLGHLGDLVATKAESYGYDLSGWIRR